MYGFHFVYSGNFLAQVEKNQFDSLRVVLGIHPQDFKWELKQGETFTAPEVVLTYSDGRAWQDDRERCMISTGSI